jgi:hypothetical protein
MAETVTLEFLARQIDCVITDQAAMRDGIRVLTTIVLHHDETLTAILAQLRAMVAQHQPFNDRLRRLEEQPAQ